MKGLPNFINDYGKAIFLHCGFDVNDSTKEKKQANKSQFVKLDTRKGYYFFKDFGSDGSYLTPISLLMEQYNLDFDSALLLAKKIYNVATNEEKKYIDNSNFKQIKVNANKIAKAKKEGDEGSLVLQDIRFKKEFTKEQLDYLKKKGNISLEVATKYLKPLQSSTIKKVCKNGSEYHFNPVKYDGLAFAIEIVEGESYKYIDKTKKQVLSLPNLNAAKEHIAENYTYNLGLNELNESKTPILVGGEMDFLAMKTLGYNVFTLGSEQPNLSEYIIEQLALKGFTPNQISVCYDTDFAGINAANQLNKKFGCKVLYIPDLEKQEWKYNERKNKWISAYNKRYYELKDTPTNTEKPQYNDICDYFNLYGSFDFRFKNLFGYDNLFLSFDKRFSESEKLEKLFIETTKNRKTIWQIPTASGKTTVACSYDFSKFGSDKLGFYGFMKLHHPDSIFVYTAPLTTIVEDLQENYPKYQVVCEGQVNAHNAKFTDTIITYNSLPTFLERIKREGRLNDVILVVDEIHEAIQSSSYQNIAEFQSIFEGVGHVIGMSATIGAIKECFNDFNILRCERLNNPNVNINLHTVSEANLLDTVMKIAVDNKEKDVIYFRNSKKIGAKTNVYQIKEALQLENIKCDVLTGGMRLEEKRNNIAYQSLIKTNKLPKECNHLVATSVLSTGVTAYVDKIVYIANRSRDITAFMQSYARDRSDNIDVELILVKEKTEKKDTKINLDINYLYELCNKSARLANKMKLANDFYYKENPEQKLEISTFIPNNLTDDVRKFVYFDRFTDSFKVNRYKMFNERYKDYCNNMSTDSYINLIKELVPNCTITIVEDKSDYDKSEQVSEILDNQKKLLANDIILLENLLKDDAKGNPIAEYVFNKTDNDKVKDAIKNYSYLSSFLNVSNKKSYILHSDLSSKKPKIENTNNDIIQELIEKRTELERKISVATSQKSIDKYSKTLEKVQDKLDNLTKENDFLTKYENESLVEVVKRNFEHLQVFFSRFNALKRNLMNAIPFEQLVVKSMDTNNTNYGLFVKQLYHNALIEVYELAKENKVVLEKQDNFLEQKFEECELDLEVIKFVSQKECSVNDFLKKFKFKGYNEKNFKRKLKVLFTDIDVSTLFIRSNRLDLSVLIGEKNAKNYLINFKSSLQNVQVTY